MEGGHVGRSRLASEATMLQDPAPRCRLLPRVQGSQHQENPVRPGSTGCGRQGLPRLRCCFGSPPPRGRPSSSWASCLPMLQGRTEVGQVSLMVLSCLL